MASTPVCARTPSGRNRDRNRLARLEDELTTLTGHINAATARVPLVLAAFDRV